MDDQYLDAFIRESEEAIMELNNSLLELESDPENQQAMDAIFRTAHTFKGDFGAMGYEDASNLTHAIEDLLDETREGEREIALHSESVERQEEVLVKPLEGILSGSPASREPRYWATATSSTSSTWGRSEMSPISTRGAVA